MSQIANNYAGGLYALATEDDWAEQFLQELETLEQSFAQEPDFLRLLAAHNISKQERCEVIDRLLRGQVHPYMLNFLKLLTEKGYIRYFDDCCQVFRRLYDKEHGIVRVEAITAVPLTQDQYGRMAEKLAETTGKKVVLTNTVDASCIAGVRLRYDDVQVDDTICNRLATMEQRLKNTQL